MPVISVAGKKLSRLQRLWFHDYIATGCVNASQSLRNVYKKMKKPINESSVTQIAAEVKQAALTKLGIDNNQLLDAMGLTNERLMKKLSDKLDAKDKLFIPGTRDEKTGLPLATSVENHNAQLKALELSLKIRGEMPTDKQEDTVEKNITITFKDERKVYEEAEIIEVEESVDEYRTPNKELPAAS